ncbi:bifunctional metallophosphatase/5'-nucleotidase [Hutsoniella sourekii]|uniref:bifunctional metallophosphatase/5'-nucleotidase n=1 Tax=Hutsoniella sourekii TaxID=87650 RepID=UPI0004AE409B|nr:metallophosphoesterase [Hutsoniella sourekii]
MKQATIFSTTDVHGYFQEGFGQIKQIKDQTPASLLIDNGDFLVGSPYASFGYSQGGISPLVELANQVGYDVMIPGNHDLDFGLDWLKDQVQALEADYVCANLFDKNGQLAFAPYVIKAVGDLRVGVIGLMTGALSQLQAPHLITEMTVLPPLEVVGDYLLELEEQADLILVAYHGGLYQDPVHHHLWYYPNLEDQAYQLMDQFPAIDGLICGHQHFTSAAIGPNGVAMVQPGSRGRYLGEQTFQVSDHGIQVMVNHLRQLEPLVYPLPAWSDFRAWLNQVVDIEDFCQWLQGEYPGHYYLWTFKGPTLADLLASIPSPIPLGQYQVRASEVPEPYRSAWPDQAVYSVLASHGVLPSYRLQQIHIRALVDDYLAAQKAN